MAWLTREQLGELGFRSLGKNVLISDRCSLYGTESMSIGSHVRIDDFAIVTAGEPVSIGSHVHIGAQAFVSGTCGLELADFAGLSPGVAIFTASDDYSGASLTGPTIPESFRATTQGKIVVGRHAIIGARSVVLPGVTIGEGAAVGCLSMISRDLQPWTIYSGVPARKVRARSQELLKVEAELMRKAS